MTTGHTDEEWQAIVDQAEHSLPKPPAECKAPDAGSEAFAKMIDHTLLKLDATEEQIDALCEEARRFDFKVCNLCIERAHWAFKTLGNSISSISCFLSCSAAGKNFR